MPPFKESDLSRLDEEYLKFVRIGDKLYVDKKTVAHADIVQNDGILEDYGRSILSDHSSVDAGFIIIGKDTSHVYGVSSSITIYENEETRRRTLEAFRQQAPNHQITGELKF